MESTIFGFNNFLAHITDINAVNFVIQKQAERNLISFFILIKVNIAGVIYDTDYILYAFWRIVSTVFGSSNTFFLIKAYFVVFCIISLVYISYKGEGLHVGSINIGFILIPYLKKPIVRRKGASLTYYMPCRPVFMLD